MDALVSCEFNTEDEEEFWLWIEEERSWVVVAEPLTPQFDLETLWKGTKSRFRICFLQLFHFVFAHFFKYFFQIKKSKKQEKHFLINLISEICICVYEMCVFKWLSSS